MTASHIYLARRFIGVYVCLPGLLCHITLNVISSLMTIWSIMGGGLVRLCKRGEVLPVLTHTLVVCTAIRIRVLAPREPDEQCVRHFTLSNPQTLTVFNSDCEPL